MILKALLSLLALSLTLQLSAGTLVINSDQSDPVPKATFQGNISKFEQQNPDIKVKYNIYDKEAYKTAIRNWLTTSPPDIVHWYAGNRMKQFVNRSLFEDVSDIWQSEGLYQRRYISIT